MIASTLRAIQKITHQTFTSGLLFCAASGVFATEQSAQQTVSPDYTLPASSRKFSIEYIAKISEIPVGTKKLRVWLPVPQNSTAQSIDELSFSSTPELGSESKYANRIAYWEIDSPRPHHEFTMRFTCERKEVRMDTDLLRLQP